jgi:hypothetical protein
MELAAGSLVSQLTVTTGLPLVLFWMTRQSYFVSLDFGTGQGPQGALTLVTLLYSHLVILHLQQQ